AGAMSKTFFEHVLEAGGDGYAVGDDVHLCPLLRGWRLARECRAVSNVARSIVQPACARWRRGLIAY
ncbi:MAG: hypothetical protein MJE63_24445, partial [Proteobacteria bacterium]|nr:hypothetical protein [Pseudomonadota bacterium]